MSWSRKFLILVAAIVVAAGVMAAKKGESAKEPEKVEKGPKEKKKEAPEAKPETTAGASGEEKSASKLSVPVPPGHDAKGLVIPYRDSEGNLQMRFTMEIGKRTDADHMDMTRLLIETFDDEGREEMTIDLPQSVLDLNTKVITTENGVLIKRSDFELTGKTMVFNTETKAGRVGGKVRMLIYNLENETSSAK
jgi:Lipopolysaccharide-assembly, LptC-related